MGLVKNVWNQANLKDSKVCVVKWGICGYFEGARVNGGSGG